MRYLKSLFSIVIAALGISCNRQSTPVAKALPKPFAVIENDGITHEFYRDITFEKFSPTIPDGSLDAIDFDLSESDYTIALVTAPHTVKDRAVEFTTTFVTEKQERIVKTWGRASGNQGDKARGLFLLPRSVESATTTESASKAEDKSGKSE